MSYKMPLVLVHHPMRQFSALTLKSASLRNRLWARIIRMASHMLAYNGGSCLSSRKQVIIIISIAEICNDQEIAVLLHLHRNHFLEAISDVGRTSAKNKYSPSVNACYESARRLIDGLNRINSQVTSFLNCEGKGKLLTPPFRHLKQSLG